MTTPSVADLSQRAREIFREIVDAYLATGEPVGSRTLSKLSSVNLSPASIRNVMQDLEELGLLAAPHTSAGRMPTQLGLRLFVDGLMQMGELSPTEQQEIEQQCAMDGRRTEEVLTQATSALSGLLSCAGLVLAPKTDIAIRQIDFVPLSPTRALAILIGEDGSVENRILQLPPGMDASVFVKAANYVNTRLAGLTLAQAQGQLAEEIATYQTQLDELSKSVVQQGLALWTADDTDRDVLIVRGQAHLLGDAHAEADLERLKMLLDDIESKRELAKLMGLVREGASTKIFIGSENKLFSLSGSSVIAAPYRDSSNRIVGVVGVIGPTRLNYARVVPMVDYTSKVLTRILSQ